jgi:hypothetical protein
MRTKIIISMCACFFLGLGTGYASGRVYSYLHPMKDIEGYWEVNCVFNHSPGAYHIYSRVSIMNREINSSADVYDENKYLKARRDVVFSIVDVNNNIFSGKILSLSIINNNDDDHLSDFINTPYTISHPVFYRLNENTIFIEQSQGHPVNSLRLLTRIISP